MAPALQNAARIERIDWSRGTIFVPSVCVLIALLALLTKLLVVGNANAEEATWPQLERTVEASTPLASHSQTFPKKPRLRDRIILANAQLSDIEKRLPASNAKSDTKTPDSTNLPPAPQLRDGPSTTLVLIAVEIVGATAYPAETFAPLYDHLLARNITLRDVAALADEITAMYRDDGYFLSRAVAPEQSVEGGILQIKINEGYLEDIIVKGDAPETVRRRLDRLKDYKPLRVKDLERALLLIGDLNGVSVSTSDIAANPYDLAAHTLTVHIDEDRIEASIFADNRGTDDAGPVQAHLRAAANSIITTGDQLSAGFFTVPDDPGELLLGDVRYQFPITDSGAYATLSGMVSRFDAGASLAAFDTESRTKQVTARFSYPFMRSRKRSFWGNVAFNGRNIEEEQLGAPQFEDKIRILSASANYRHDYWNGVTTLFAETSQGLNMLGASSGGGSLSRPDADASFTKIEGQITRYQNIGKEFGLYVAASGQVSFEPLLASEEFAIGGARFGRAYDYAEVTGDDGFATLVELRHGEDPGLSLLDFYQIYGFFDYGAVWNENAAPGLSRMSLSSAGAGLRLTFPASLYVTIEAAKPLDRTPFTQNDRDWRGFFSVSKSF